MIETPWTAQDYALLISASATALSAILGIAVPLWTSWTNRTSEWHKSIHRELQSAIDKLLIESDRLSKSIEAAAFDQPMYEKASALGINYEGRNLPNLFDLQELHFASLASSYGLDGTKLALVVRLRSTVMMEACKLAATGQDSAAELRAALDKKQVYDAKIRQHCSEFWQAVRKAYPA